MKKERLFQRNFVIKELIPDQIGLARTIRLWNGELLLDKQNEELRAYLLGQGDDARSDEERVKSLLQMASLVSNRTPLLESRGQVSIESREEIGSGYFFPCRSRLDLVFPEEAVKDIEKYAPKYIEFVGRLHQKYYNVLRENEFVRIALNYFYEARKRYIDSEGLLNTAMSLEALYNEGGGDIAYKLSLRAAFLLGLSGKDSKDVFRKLKEFYRERSKLVHGNRITQWDSNRHIVSDYTRTSIMIFLVLLEGEGMRRLVQEHSESEKPRKKNLLEYIDCAMLDEEKGNDLKDQIEKGLVNFKLPVPRAFSGSGKQGGYKISPW
jgi:hypothetical protein